MWPSACGTFYSVSQLETDFPMTFHKRGNSISENMAMVERPCPSFYSWLVQYRLASFDPVSVCYPYDPHHKPVSEVINQSPFLASAHLLSILLATPCRPRRVKLHGHYVMRRKGITSWSWPACLTHFTRSDNFGEVCSNSANS